MDTGPICGYRGAETKRNRPKGLDVVRRQSVSVIQQTGTRASTLRCGECEFVRRPSRFGTRPFHHGTLPIDTRGHPVKRIEKSLLVVDAGCGLGAGLTWLERAEPSWKFLGYTISSSQQDWIQTHLNNHKFQTKLQSFDEIQERQVDVTRLKPWSILET